MAEENWETEIDDRRSYVPNFSSLETDPTHPVENGKNTYSTYNEEFNNQSFGSEHDFGGQRGTPSERVKTGMSRGIRSERGRGSGMHGRGISSNKPDQDYSRNEGYNGNDGQKRGGFQRRGFGGNNSGQRIGFSGRGGFGDEDKFSGFSVRSDEDKRSGFSGRGFNNEKSDFGSRGRRGGRGRFGQSGGYRGGNEDVGVESEGIEKQDPGVPKPPPYIPPPPPDTEEDIFRQYQCGINFDKYDEILVDVKGNDVPPAILTFEEANLCDTLNKNISKAGYVKLTPVQKHSIPIILAGRDLMACAQTGSGKTAAFLLPILAQMMNEGITASQFKEFQEPEAIIVAPTRELINQIYLDARKFAYGTCVRPVVVYGGTQTGHSIRQILQGCNILCATPGRLMDIINREKIGLSKVRYVVLDEADRMLDMGFAPDIAKLMQNASMPSKEKRQTLMFSATYPEDIRRLALTYLKPDHLFVVVGQVGGACSDVEQTILEVKEYSKKDKLIEILQNIGNERTMVFVSTKKKADFMATLLCQERVRTTSIHGDREQREREKALQDFRSGNCPVIVATSVAARGLDIENVQHVINLDLPKEIEEYVHRIGRTGRCGNTGKAISFFDPDQDRGIASRLVRVLTDAHQVVPVWLEEIAFGGHGTSTYSTCENTARDEQNYGGERENNFRSPVFSQATEDAWED